MKVLVLTFYYAPDLCAGSFRSEALIKALRKYRSQGLEVDLITTQPNRYSEVATTVASSEDHGWLRIKRINLPPHKSEMKDQARAFIHYAKGVRAMTKEGDWDLVFATSSRLMTAVLGALVSRRLSLPLYLDVRDLFTDTMSDVLKGSLLRQVLPFFNWLERRTFQRANHINVVSGGFLDHIHQIVPEQTCTVFTNGIDSDFLSCDFRKNPISNEVPVILYAGNIGEGQGLHRIIPGAAVALEGIARLRLIGSGGRLEKLKSALVEAGTTNVNLRPPMPRGKLLNEYRASDLLFLHLNDYPAFDKVLPSKIFEYAATGKPIVAGVQGHAAEFLRKEVPDAQIFEPCDVSGMVKAVIQSLSMSNTADRNTFCATFERSNIMDNMAAHIFSTLRGHN